MARKTSSRSGRKPLTKDALLPLTSTKVRALSLENHLALATIRSGRGNLDQLCCLLQVVYLAFYMRDETTDGVDLVPYRQAEVALDACITRVERDEPCLLLEKEQAAIERVLVLHDAQLAAVPRHRYLTAWDRLQRFIVGQKHSPIPSDAVTSASGPCIG